MTELNDSKKMETMPDHSQKPRFEVFYDGMCPLCKREIDMIRGKDKQNLLLLTDIAAPGFRLPGKSLRTLMSEIHGRYPDGRFVTGVDVFREIYSTLGFGWAVKITRVFGIRHLLAFGYTVFAKLRFMHARHRMKSMSGCDSGKCST